MTDITTTNNFPVASAITASFAVTSNAFATTVGTAETGKFEARLQSSVLPAGKYELTISGLAFSDNLLNIPTGQYSLDGGSNWVAFSAEAETVAAGKPFNILVPLYSYTGATIDYVVQVKKSLADADTVTLTNCGLTMKRVG